MPISPTKIRSRREALRLTQAEAAHRAGMKQPNWQHIESGGRVNPSISTAQAIAAALRTTLSKIVD